MLVHSKVQNGDSSLLHCNSGGRQPFGVGLNSQWDV